VGFNRVPARRDDPRAFRSVSFHQLHDSPDAPDPRALTTIYDMGLWHYPYCTAPSALKRPLRHVKESAEKALGVITGSEISKSEIVSLLGVPSEKVHVVYPGLSPAFREDTNDTGSSHLRTKYRSLGPYIVCVIILEHRRNIPS